MTARSSFKATVVSAPRDASAEVLSVTVVLTKMFFELPRLRLEDGTFQAKSERLGCMPLRLCHRCSACRRRLASPC